MGFIFNNLAYDFLSIITALLCCILIHLIQTLTYWKRRNVETASGGFNPFAGKSYGETFKIIYEELKSKKKGYGGTFLLLRPAFVLADIRLVQDIMQKDFNSFSDRGYYINEKDDLLSGHIFNLGMPKWKHIRTKLTPTFTSGKVKMMFHTISTCGSELTNLIDESCKSGPVDIKDIQSRFSTDVIGSCAFGIDCNSMKNPKTKFREYGDKVFEFTLIGMLQFLIPHSILRFLRLKLFSQDVEDFFAGTVKKTVEYREINDIERRDFLQLLIELKNKGYVGETGTRNSSGDNPKKHELTMNEITAQCFAFFAAGFETSASTTTFTLLELAVNQDIQNKIREEILGVLKKHDEEITYEAIMEMTYMDKVIYEALRKYPPVPVLDRECTKNYQIPGTSLTIKKGILVRIPILGIHNDPEFYPNPDTFDPERFNEENKMNRIPFTWLPFGDGPRICIGLRFGVLQVKVALVAILKEYRVNLNEKTIYPIKFMPKSFTLSAEGGIWLDVSKI